MSTGGAGHSEVHKRGNAGNAGPAADGGGRNGAYARSAAFPAAPLAAPHGSAAAHFLGQALPPPLRPAPGAHREDASAAAQEPRAARKRIPCAFYLKTGNCAFGTECKFEHPLDQPATQYNSLGLPLRPGEPDCAYYVRNLHCGYGASCKFHHAEPVMGWVPLPMVDTAALGVGVGPQLMPYQLAMAGAAAQGAAGGVMPGAAGGVMPGAAAGLLRPPLAHMLPGQVSAHVLPGQAPAQLPGALPSTAMLPFPLGMPVQLPVPGGLAPGALPPQWGPIPHAGPQVLLPSQALSAPLPPPLFAGFQPLPGSPSLLQMQQQAGYLPHPQATSAPGSSRDAASSAGSLQLRTHERSSRRRGKGRGSGGRQQAGSGSDERGSSAAPGGGAATATTASDSRSASGDLAGEVTQLSLRPRAHDA